MNPYTLAAIIIVTIGVVVCVLLIYQGGKATVNAGRDAATGIATTIGETTKPVAQGFADICHAIAGRIETKREELQKLRTQTTALTQENERLRNQQIRVDQIKPIFQVAFFQSDLSTRDFVKEPVQSTPGGNFERNEEIEYLGVYSAKNTQKFGIDFEELKFHILSPTVIQVSGLGKTKLIGNPNTEVKPEHTELRKHLTGGPKSDAHEILIGDLGKLMLERDRKQRDDVQRAITQERKIDQVEQGVELMTMQFLKDYFAPRGYSVIKASKELTDAKSIFEIQDQINAQVDTLISANHRQLADVEGKVEAAEHELKLDIQKLKET